MLDNSDLNFKDFHDMVICKLQLRNTTTNNNNYNNNTNNKKITVDCSMLRNDSQNMMRF